MTFEQMMRLKTELAKTGVDPSYINYLETKLRGPSD